MTPEPSSTAVGGRAECPADLWRWTLGGEGEVDSVPARVLVVAAETTCTARARAWEAERVGWLEGAIGEGKGVGCAMVPMCGECGGSG